MIIEALINMIFIPLNLLVGMMPAAIVESASTVALPDIVRMGVCFFPTDVIALTVGMFSSWYVIQLGWAIIEWVYKKIPGVS